MKFTVLLLITLVALSTQRSYPIYSQCDSRWGSKTLGFGSKTICQAGCLMSSVAMALSGLGKNYNPDSLNTWLKSNGGFQGSLFVWGSVNQLGMTFSSFPGKNFKPAFDSGKICILNVRNGAHWVLMTGYNGNTISVNDPGFNVNTYQASDVVDSGCYNGSGRLESTFEDVQNFLPQDNTNETRDGFVPGEVEIFDDSFDRVHFDLPVTGDPEMTMPEEGLLKGSCSCDNIEKMVADAEGKKSCVYLDSKGIPTIGIGFNLNRGDAASVCAKYGIDYTAIRSGAKCLTDSQISQLFQSDLAWAKPAPAKYISGFTSKPQCVQNVLIDMTFNMGANFLGGWPNFVSQVSNNKFADAAANMQSTLWCSQVKTRCTRNVNIMKSCA